MLIGLGGLLLLITTLSLAILSVNAKSGVKSRCENAGDSMIIVEGGLEKDRYKKYLKAAKGKASFLVDYSTDLSEKSELIEKIMDRNGSRSIVLKLNAEDLKEATEVKKSKKKLRKVVKKIKADFGDKSEGKLRLVMVPSKTDKRIIKAFKKSHVAVIKSAYKSKSRSDTKKLIKKLKKKGSSLSVRGGIVLFKVSEKNSRSQLKKLRKAMTKGNGSSADHKLVKARSCFKKKREETEKEETEYEEEVEEDKEKEKLDIVEMEHEYDIEEEEEDLVDSAAVSEEEEIEENEEIVEVKTETVTETEAEVNEDNLIEVEEDEQVNNIQPSTNNTVQAPTQVTQVHSNSQQVGHFNPASLGNDDESDDQESEHNEEEEEEEEEVVEVDMATIYHKDHQEHGDDENIIDISEINPALNTSESQNSASNTAQ